MRLARLAPLAVFAAMAFSAPVRADEPALTWGECPSTLPAAGVLCGTLAVPEARDADPPRMLALPVVRLPAAFVSDTPPLVVVGMGPGLVPVPLDSDGYAFLALLAKDRDVVVLEPRGLGGATRLDCDLGSEPEALFGPVFPSEAVAACRAALATHADLARYRDSDIALDLADLIQALGATQADILAFTAGGRAALAAYVLQPDLVRRVILASPILPEAAFPVALGQGAANAQSSVSRFCSRSNSCSGLYLSRRFRQAAEQLDKQPAIATLDDPEGVGKAKVTIDGDTLILGLHLVALRREGFVVTAPLIDLAGKGEAEAAAKAILAARRDFARGALGLHFALVCSADGDKLSDLDPEAFKGLHVGDRWLDAYRRACQGWPGVGQAAGDRPDTPPPPLLVILPSYGGLVDPEAVKEAATQADTTRFLILERQPDDWPADEAARTCAASLVAAYLALERPGDKLRDACAKDLTIQSVAPAAP